MHLLVEEAWFSSLSNLTRLVVTRCRWHFSETELLSPHQRCFSQGAKPGCHWCVMTELDFRFLDSIRTMLLEPWGFISVMRGCEAAFHFTFPKRRPPGKSFPQAEPRAHGLGAVKCGHDFVVCYCYCFYLCFIVNTLDWSSMDLEVLKNQRKNCDILLGCTSDFQNCA